jgi:hypothetical protein
MHPFTGPWPIVQLLPGASYKLEFASNPSQKEKNMPPISLPTPQNTYILSLEMVRIIVIASLTSNLIMHLIKKLVLTVSSHRNLSRYLCILPAKEISRISITLPYWNSMMGLAHSHGWTMTNESGS